MATWSSSYTHSSSMGQRTLRSSSRWMSLERTRAHLHEWGPCRDSRPSHSHPTPPQSPQSMSRDASGSREKLGWWCCKESRLPSPLLELHGGCCDPSQAPSERWMEGALEEEPLRLLRAQIGSHVSDCSTTLMMLNAWWIKPPSVWLLLRSKSPEEETG